MSHDPVNIYLLAVLSCTMLSIAHLIAWNIYYRIFFSKQQTIKWYHFWDARSGGRGMLLAAAIFLAFYGLLFYILLL